MPPPPHRLWRLSPWVGRDSLCLLWPAFARTQWTGTVGGGQAGRGRAGPRLPGQGAKA